MTTIAIYLICVNRICDVMVSMLAASVVDRGFEHRSGQTTEHNIIICCFSAQYTALRRKSNDWLAWYHDNVSEWGSMSLRGLVSQHYANPVKRVGLVQSGPHRHFIEH